MANHKRIERTDIVDVKFGEGEVMRLQILRAPAAQGMPWIAQTIEKKNSKSKLLYFQRYMWIRLVEKKAP